MPARRPNEVSAGGVVVRAAEGAWQVCLIRTGQHWGFPKGNLERGETPQQAALREIAEECGIPAESLHIEGTLPASEYVYRRDGRLIFKLVHQFLVTVTGEVALDPQLDEIDDAQWLPFEEALARASFRDTRAALEAAQAHLH